MVEIQRLTTAPNGFGGYTEIWTTHIAEYDGMIDQLNGNERNERLVADKVSPISTHILIGPVDDINENDRILFNGKLFDVVNVDNPMNMDRHLEILLEYKGDA